MIEQVAISSRGLRLNLDLLAGRAGDPAVLFLPGTAKFARFYLPFLERLRAGGYHVLGLDLQGHGHSDGRRGDFTMDELVQNTRDAMSYALERFGPRLGLVGTSQGALVVLYTLAADDRASSAICHNSALLNEPGARRINVSPTSKLLRPLVGLGAALVPGFRIPVRRYLELWRVYDNLERGRELESDPLVVKTYTLRSYASLASARPVRPVEQITTPTLFLAAEQDRLFPSDYVRSIFDRLTCPKQFTVVKGSGHMLFVEYVDQSLPPVLEWLESSLRHSRPEARAG